MLWNFRKFHILTPVFTNAVRACCVTLYRGMTNCWSKRWLSIYCLAGKHLIMNTIFPRCWCDIRTWRYFGEIDSSRADCLNYSTLASFPGYSLTTTKNKNGRGEPGINSHVIAQHDNVALTNKEPKTSLTWRPQSSRKVISVQEFVTATGLLLCSYVGVY